MHMSVVDETKTLHDEYCSKRFHTKMCAPTFPNCFHNERKQVKITLWMTIETCSHNYTLQFTVVSGT
jgi:hypothetical protein